MIIHGVPISVHTRKAVLAAQLKGLDVKQEPVIPFRPPANWSELSPTGLIPVLQDGDFTLADSTAICLYLDRIAPKPALLPSDAKQMGRALFLDAYAGGTLFRHVVHGLFFQRVIRPGILGESTDEAAVDAILTNQAPKVLGYLDSIATKHFLVGDAVSIADLAVTSNLINLSYLGIDVGWKRYPKLHAYFRHHLEAPLVRQSLEAEKPFAAQMGLDRGFIE